MPSIFHWGPYQIINDEGGLPPGEEDHLYFGPYDWYAYVLTITPHVFSVNRTLAVTSMSSGKDGNDHRFMYCTVKNVGTEPANYAVWLAGVRP